MHEGRANIEAQMRTLDKSVQRAPHADVLVHIDGTTLKPWALTDRPCVWQSQARDADGFARIFVALKDTGPDPPQPESAARTALRMVLASGTDD